MTKFYLIEGVNPEPWEAPDLSTARRGKKIVPVAHTTLQQRLYQEALHESFELKYGCPLDHEEPVGTMQFYFWREVAEYETPHGRKGHANYADATNLMKACEDALQGLLYENDTTNLRVTSEIMSQSPETQPMILIIAGPPPTKQTRNWAQGVADSMKDNTPKHQPYPSNLHGTDDIPF